MSAFAPSKYGSITSNTSPRSRISKFMSASLLKDDTSAVSAQQRVQSQTIQDFEFQLKLRNNKKEKILSSIIEDHKDNEGYSAKRKIEKNRSKSQSSINVSKKNVSGIIQKLSGTTQFLLVSDQERSIISHILRDFVSYNKHESKSRGVQNKSSSIDYSGDGMDSESSPKNFKRRNQVNSDSQAAKLQISSILNSIMKESQTKKME